MRCDVRAVLTGLVASVTIAGCTGAQRTVPFAPLDSARQTVLQNHAVIGFSVDSPRRAAKAAQEGITSTILYGGSPAPKSALESALKAHAITVIDAGISGILFDWECHRTHTIKPPPSSYPYNYYCRTDEDPHVKSEAVVLHDVSNLLERDVDRKYVAGYWVLDDWASWDPGSAHELLQKVHALIVAKTPGRPAICGFGAGVAKPGKVDWDPGTAANYSTGGCDVVGWYNYSPFGRRHPSLGKALDWTMKALLPAMQRSLEKKGWEIAKTPLYGIGQAWGGSYEKRYFQPGLTRGEMVDQAKAFCSFGADYIGWYAWDDSGFDSRTQTPNSSAAIAAGMAAGLSTCGKIWK